MKNFRTKLIILSGFTLMMSSSLVQADDSLRTQPHNLSYLSVPMGDITPNTAEVNSVDDFPAEAAANITKPKKAFSPEQEKLMQDLSKVIIVNSMGFMLALNLKY